MTSRCPPTDFYINGASHYVTSKMTSCDLLTSPLLTVIWLILKDRCSLYLLYFRVLTIFFFKSNHEKTVLHFKVCSLFLSY